MVENKNNSTFTEALVTVIVCYIFKFKAEIILLQWVISFSLLNIIRMASSDTDGQTDRQTGKVVNISGEALRSHILLSFLTSAVPFQIIHTILLSKNRQTF